MPSLPGRICLRAETSGERLDQALLRALRERSPTFTRARLKHWFEAGRVLYRGRPAQPSHALDRGECEVEITALSEEDLAPPLARPSRQGSFLPVLYEDEELLVLHKHSGVPTLPHDDQETETAVGSALARVPALAGIGDRPLEPGLLHRLDTGTSGCLAFAKTQARFEELRRTWKTQAVRKFYRALTHPPADPRSPGLPLSLANPIAASEKSAKRMVVLQPGKKISHSGKPQAALTHLLRAHESASPWQDLQIEIETGVRHQIRVHLASIGLPIAGDPIYGRKNDELTSSGLHERLWLHAWRLELPLGPGRTLLIEAALPTDWPKPRT